MGNEENEDKVVANVSTFEQVIYDNNYPETEKQIRLVTESNVNRAMGSIYVKNRSGIFGISRYKNYFNRTGSLKVESLDLLGSSKGFFTDTDGRYFKDSRYRRKFILRGPRYVAAIDESLSVTQKIEIFVGDIESGIKIVRERRFKTNTQFLELSPVLDYVKNGLITLYNAYTHRERMGRLLLDDSVNAKEYQKIKGDLLTVVKESVISFYLSLVNDLSEDVVNSLLNSFETDVLAKIHEKISTEFKMFQFSARTVVRPESCHPLILAAFAHNVAEKYPATKHVFGLPSGGTELACLIHKYFEVKKGISNQLVLLPISIHSTKNEFNRKRKKLKKEYKFLIPKSKSEDGTANSLLVDDNSCTGETLKLASNLITTANRNLLLDIKVAEADTIRARLKSQDGKSQTLLIAPPQTFSESVGILPISRRRKRNHDLRELIESRNLFNYYSKRKKKTLTETIKGEVIADAILNKYQILFEHLNDANSIQKFKHTFLSNFYGVEISYDGETYPSVEHAYIAQKYKFINLGRLTVNQINDLNEVFRIKGINMELEDFSEVFDDRNLPAGVLKRISNKLQAFGFKPANWDDRRISIMIDLLIQKFSKPELISLLAETNDKYLVEGNDWNDTFWGVTGGKIGKNFLGRIIMAIRGHYYNGVLISSASSERKPEILKTQSYRERLKEFFDFQKLHK